MNYVDSVVKTFKGQSRDVVDRVKTSTGLLLAIAHVTATKDLNGKGLNGKVANGASLDEVKEAYGKLSYDARLMCRKDITNQDIVELVMALIICGDVTLVDNDPAKGMRLTVDGMLTAVEMYKELKPMKESAVYEFIKRAELEIELGNDDIKLQNN